MFTLYGHSTVGAATNIEFVTVPEHGTLYQATSDGKNALSADMDSPITAGSITDLVGGRFYYVVDQVEAYTGLEDDWDTFTYYVIDEYTGMRSSEVRTKVTPFPRPLASMRSTCACCHMHGAQLNRYMAKSPQPTFDPFLTLA